MVPTRRMIGLGCIPIVAALVSAALSVTATLSWSLAGLAFLCFLIDGVLAGRQLGLRMERQSPAQLYVDQPQTISWTVENRSSHGLALQLADGIPSASQARPDILELLVPPGTRTTAHYELVPGRRGPAAFGDLTYRVRGPLGLAWRQRQWPAAMPVRCLPHLADWKTAELAERRALMRQAGSHRYRWRGSGTVFESLREYSPQDDIRWVDWKATARHGAPISRNYEVERHQQVMILVDASRAMTTYCGRRTKFDAVLEAAVLVARAALDQGDALGLLLFADRVEAYLHPRRERAQLTAVMELLFAKQPRLVEPDFESALTRVAQASLRRSLIILFTDVTIVEGTRRMLAYVRNLTPRHLPLVVTIADETLEQMELVEPRTVEEFYRTGVANELMFERAVLLEELHRGGAEVLDSPADQVAARAIERYLDLKRRLRL